MGFLDNMKESLGGLGENISQSISDISDNAERNKYLRDRVVEVRNENDKFLNALVGKEAILIGDEYSLLKDVTTGLLFYKYKFKDEGMMTPSWQIIPVYKASGEIMNYSELTDDIKTTITKQQQAYHDALEKAYGGDNEE